MLFNSYIFIFAFLPLVLAGWWLVRAPTPRLIFLTLASYVFYGWWDWRFVPLMLASTTVDYVAGARIVATDEQASRKRWLVGSLVFNMAILGIFKYYGFFANTMNTVIGAAHGRPIFPIVNIVLPIGISFYTFNSMSYTIDIYRRRVEPSKDIFHFSAFVAMFPHLVAGPIVRYSDVASQFAALKKRLSSEQASKAVCFFVVGLAKKLLIADQLAPFVNDYFASPTRGFVTTWLAVLGYTFQLYFDFSGYSDMAVGLAHALGIQFPQNFDSPYKATSPSDFWRRWHMSLSTWLRDYLFVPLGGSRKGRSRTLFNLAVTMFLGGLWHGAQWTFVVWGLYHGGLLVLHRLAEDRKLYPTRPVLARGLTFLAVVVGWVFFRAATLPQAASILATMFGRADFRWAALPPRFFLASLTIAGILAFVAPNSWEMDLRPRPRLAVGLAVAFVASVLLLEKASPFLYFQF